MATETTHPTRCPLTGTENVWVEEERDGKWIGYNSATPGDNIIWANNQWDLRLAYNGWLAQLEGKPNTGYSFGKTPEELVSNMPQGAIGGVLPCSVIID